MSSSCTYAARDVIGQPVGCLGGIEIGTIAELVVTRDSGRIRYVIVEPKEDALGVQDVLLAIPWRAVGYMYMAPAWFLLPMPIEEVKRAPVFHADSWPDFSDTREMAEVHAFYGEPPS